MRQNELDESWVSTIWPRTARAYDLPRKERGESRAFVPSWVEDLLSAVFTNTPLGGPNQQAIVNQCAQAKALTPEAEVLVTLWKLRGE